MTYFCSVVRFSLWGCSEVQGCARGLWAVDTNEAVRLVKEVTVLLQEGGEKGGCVC